MHVSSSMPAAAASVQNLTWLLSVIYMHVIRKQWNSLLHYTSVGSLQILQQVTQEAQWCYNLCADTACFSLVHRSLLPWDEAMLV